jgi:DNA-directed RNA polymerase subunit RPC12/RpoP
MNTLASPKSFGPFQKWFALAALLFLAAIVMTGCGKPGWEAIDSNANGFICQKCGAKFYTDRAVFAEFCPNCKDANIRPVMGYVCDKCQHLTLSTATHGSTTCEKCQATVSGSKLPTAKEFVEWGAVKKTKAEVCKN